MNVSFHSLQENLHIGREAVNQVKKEYPYGFISDSRYDTFSPKRNHRISVKLAEKVFWTRDIVEQEKRYGSTTYDAVKKAVDKTQAANCGEQAIILSQILNDMGIKNKVVSMHVYKKDSPYMQDGHTFCVIGAEENADWRDPSTWGNEAVIADTWAGLVEKSSSALRKFTQILKVDKKEHNIKIWPENLF